MLNYIAIFVGGGLGAAARFALSRYVSQSIYAAIPTGTLAVNVIGSLVMGFLFRVFETVAVPSEVRIFVMIGFLGAFTTFSTYSLESVLLFAERQYGPAMLNVLVQNLAAFGALVLGFVLSNGAMRLFRGGA